MREASDLAAGALSAWSEDDALLAAIRLEQAAERVDQAALENARSGSPQRHQALLRARCCLSLHLGEVECAQDVIAQARCLSDWNEEAANWTIYLNETAWPDRWLVAAIRTEKLHAPALDALVVRYAGRLVQRCRYIANDQAAADLAQDVWFKVIRSRRSLKPGRSFDAYLKTVALNLWRDRHRASVRAGAMSECNLLSLDQPGEHVGDNAPSLVTIVPDERSSRSLELQLRIAEVEAGLHHLPPLMREVLLARFIEGCSCAEIGRRYSRTEQTVSGWVRHALAHMRNYLSEPSRAESTAVG